MLGRQQPRIASLMAKLRALVSKFAYKNPETWIFINTTKKIFSFWVFNCSIKKFRASNWFSDRISQTKSKMQIELFAYFLYSVIL